MISTDKMNQVIGNALENKPQEPCPERKSRKCRLCGIDISDRPLISVFCSDQHRRDHTKIEYRKNRIKNNLNVRN